MSIWHARTCVTVVYQLRVVLRGVSPLIWRRLLVPDTTTIADLHAVLQSAFGWADEHLHRFVVHGREYGITYPGGVGFRDNPRRVGLAGFGLRVGERFVYGYDFIDGWRHDIRVEQVTAPEPGRSYPVCVVTDEQPGGRVADCVGLGVSGGQRLRHPRQHRGPLRAARQLLLRACEQTSYLRRRPTRPGRSALLDWPDRGAAWTRVSFVWQLDLGSGTRRT